MAEIDKFIRPLYIESRLETVKYGYDGNRLSLEAAEAIENAAGGRPKLTGMDAALRDRLVARLKLSKRYDRQLKRMRDKIGMTALGEKLDETSDCKAEIEWQIIRAKPVTRTDMGRKLALYDYYKGEFYNEELVRDFRRLFQTQTTLAA